MKKILLGILLLFISFGGYSQNPAKFKDGIELKPSNAPTAKFGTVYFDTAQNIFFGYDGTEWLNLGVKTSTDGWLKLGNSGTVDGTNFIGTTDNIPLTFRVNNIQAGKIDHIKQNYSLGFETLLNNTTGFNNVAIGHESLKFNTEGFSLTAIGGLSLNLNTIGYDNTSIGEWTLAYNLTGQRNLAVGGVALNSNTTGDSNTAVGQYALNQNRTGDNNTAIGRSALNTVQGTHKAITSFSDYSGTVAGTVKATSIAHGRSTSNSVVISPTNPWGTGYKGTHIITVIDVDNFYFTDTWTTTGTAEWSLTGELGLNNTALGMDAGSGIVTGSGNTIIGYQIGNVAATLENNIILSSAGISRAQYDGSKWNYSDYGSGAITGTPTYTLQVDTNGNIIEGGLSGIAHLEFNNTDKTVWNNGKSNITTNTSFGEFALKAITTGYSNVAIGSYALTVNTDGDQNTAIGMQSLQGNTIGDRNTAIGMFSLSANISGKENTASGLSSLQNNTIGDYNIGFGRSALQNNETGDYNVSIGWKSGAFTNGLVGDNVTPQNSIFIGASTESLTNNDTNQIVIGYNADGQGTNTIVLGNNSITETYLKGTLEALSYGSGTITGTPTYNLVVDASGTIIESSLSSGGTVTSVGTTGTVSGITLTGTVTTSGNLTLGGTLSLTSGNVTDGLGFTPYNATNPNGYTDDQTSIVGITGTKSQFDTSVTDGDFVFVGDDITGKSASTDALNSATTTVNVSSATAPTTGQVLTATSSTAATWQTTATGSTAGTYDFVASGTISTGQVVGLRSDGKVEIIDDSIIADDYGTASVFQSSTTIEIASTFDSNSNKVIIAYRDDGNSSFGTAIVGTVSGTSISFGTAVVFETADSRYPSITFDSNSNKVIIAYRDDGNSSFGTAIVGTVSGTSISFGTAVVFNSSATNNMSTTFDSLNNKVVISYRDDGNSLFGTAIVGTVSGTSISFGTAVVFETANASYASITFDSNTNTVVISYSDDGNSSFGTAIVGTVSGTSISFGTAVVFETANASNMSTTFDSLNNKVIIAYVDNGNSSSSTAIVGTVSGTSISFGTAVVFNSDLLADISITFDSNTNTVVISYRNFDNSNFGTSSAGIVNGTNISFNLPVVFESSAVEFTNSIFDSLNNKVITSYQDEGNFDRGTSIVYTPEIITTNVLTTIGISTEAISDTATGTITVIAGVNDQQTGLTVGNLYYVQYDGTVTDTPNQSFSFRTLGTAITTTKILIQNIE